MGVGVGVRVQVRVRAFVRVRVTAGVRVRVRVRVRDRVRDDAPEMSVMAPDPRRATSAESNIPTLPSDNCYQEEVRSASSDVRRDNRVQV